MRFIITPSLVVFVPEVSLVIPIVEQTIITIALLMEPFRLWCVNVKVLAIAATTAIGVIHLTSMVL